MQSGRGIIPEVLPAIEYSKALDEMQKADFPFICYESEPHVPLKELYENAFRTKRIYKTFSFFIGPEGGISEKEFLLAKEKDIPACSLGKRILRTETAPLCVLSALMFMTGNLG